MSCFFNRSPRQIYDVHVVSTGLTDNISAPSKMTHLNMGLVLNQHTVRARSKAYASELMRAVFLRTNTSSVKNVVSKR